MKISRPPIRVSLACLVIAAVIGCDTRSEYREMATPARMETTARGDFAPQLALVGTLRAAQTFQMEAAGSGTLRFPPRFAHGLRTGEAVQAGELLAEVRNEETLLALHRAQLVLDQSLADLAVKDRTQHEGIASRVEFERSKLVADLSRVDFETTKKAVDALRIVAPRAGRLVITRSLPAGAHVDAGTVLGEIVTVGPSRVECDVAASDRELLRSGQRVLLRGPSGWTTSGHIAEVAAVIAENGTARVIADLDDHPGETSPPPGTGLDVEVELEREHDVLTIPVEAIVAGDEGPAVFVAATSGGAAGSYRVKRVAVETGGRAKGRVEVKNGLREGDRVVVSGADALADRSLVIESKQ